MSVEILTAVEVDHLLHHNLFALYLCHKNTY